MLAPLDTADAAVSYGRTIIETPSSTQRTSPIPFWLTPHAIPNGHENGAARHKKRTSPPPSNAPSPSSTMRLPFSLAYDRPMPRLSSTYAHTAASSPVTHNNAITRSASQYALHHGDAQYNAFSSRHRTAAFPSDDDANTNNRAHFDGDPSAPLRAKWSLLPRVWFYWNRIIKDTSATRYLPQTLRTHIQQFDALFIGKLVAAVVAAALVFYCALYVAIYARPDLSLVTAISGAVATLFRQSDSDTLISRLPLPIRVADVDVVSGYEVGGALSVEEEEDALQRILQKRVCNATDIACLLPLFPLAPPSLRVTSTPRQLVLMVITNAGFVDMTMNLICSADSVGIQRNRWLIVAADTRSFEYFLLRGVTTVLMPETSTNDATNSAADWATPQHIRINREKIPLILILLQHNIDVVLVDADLVFLSPIDDLFIGGDIDLQIMFDYPHEIIADLIGPDVATCVDSAAKPQRTLKAVSSVVPSAICPYLFEMNGGFFLIRSSRNTVQLLKDMAVWLQQHPADHDQEALRVILKQRHSEAQLRFVRDDGMSFPQQTMLAETDERLSLRYLDPLLAPNGGLFFLRGRDAWLEESAKRHILSPIVVHVNWIIGHARKLAMLKRYGLWALGPNQRCQSVAALITQRYWSAAQSPEPLTAATRSDYLIPHRAVQRLQKPPTIAPFDVAPPIALLFASPKPTRTFTSLPTRRSADRDGFGARAGVENMTSQQIDALKAANALQLDAQLIVLRSWFALAGSGLVDVAIFSDDDGHRILSEALSFDLVDRFDTDEFGAPKLHSVWRRAEHLARRRRIPLLFYSNGDLFYQDNALETISALLSYGFSELVAVGIRHALAPTVLSKLGDEYRQDMAQLKSPLISSRSSMRSRSVVKAKLGINSTAELLSVLASSAQRFQSTEAIDFFLFTPGVFDWSLVPKFLLGRIAYDNWLLHYANSRKSTTAVDVSETLTAVHINHGGNVLESHGAPNSLVNMRLGGVASRKGLGRLESVQWRTRRLTDNTIQVVRKRPTAAHIASLYDAANDAAFILHHRPTLIVVTVDNAFVNVFRNWLAAMRRARGTSEGILVLSAGPICSAIANALGLAVFDLAQGERATNALNGQSFSYLQILNLRAQSLLLLLEFGYDILNSHVDEVWMRDPFLLIDQLFVVASDALDHDEDARRADVDEADVIAASIASEYRSKQKLTAMKPKQSARKSSSSAATKDLPIGDGLDMIGITYDQTPMNISMGGLFLRHTPETLRLWRRVLSEIVALVARASIAYQVHLGLLYEDWYIQFELEENEQLRWAFVTLSETTDMRRHKTWRELRAGVLIDAPTVEKRMKDNGLWLYNSADGDDRHFLWLTNNNATALRESLTPQNVRRLLSLPSCVSDECPPLTSSERSVLQSALSPYKSVGILPLHGAINTTRKWLERAMELDLQHFIVLADNTKQFEDWMKPIISKYSRTVPVLYNRLAPMTYESARELPLSLLGHVTRRLIQLVDEDVLVMLIDPDSVWFDSPLSWLNELDVDTDADAIDEALTCDVHSYVHRNRSMDAGMIAFHPTMQTHQFLSVVHQAYTQRITEQLNSVDASASAPFIEADLPFDCLVASANTLRFSGALSVCALDPYLFPSAYLVFELGDAMDSGVYPIVSPARYTHPDSGLVKEYTENWSSWAIRQPLISPPSMDDSHINGHVFSHCTANSEGESVGNFQLTIRILAYNRADSLNRLLQSLLSTDFDSDHIRLIISVDRPLPSAAASQTADGDDDRQRLATARAAVIKIASAFEWPFGPYSLIDQQMHIGLVGQWLSAYDNMERNDLHNRHLVIVLEDDLQLSPLWYLFVRSSICQYYLNQTHFDPYLYGISLQSQEYVVGQSVRNSRKVDKLMAEWESKQTQHNESIANPPDPATIFDIAAHISAPLYRYQLIGTWGLLLFPAHWNSFKSWYNDKVRDRDFQPCVPFLECSVWWSAHPLTVWSQWMIRYTFERGWYCLYTNIKSASSAADSHRKQSHRDSRHDVTLALAVNHRERGENFVSALGASHQLLTKTSELTAALAMSAQSGLLLPPLSSLPLYDFHMNKMSVNARALAERILLLKTRHWKRACAPFKPPKPPSNYQVDS